MTRLKKILLLLATIAPIIYFFAFLLFTLLLVFRVNESENIFKSFQYFFVVHILMMFWGMGLVAFYLVHLFKKSGLPQNDLILWTILLLFTASFGMLVYWYLKIWKQQPSERAAQQVTAADTSSGSR